MCLIYQLSMEFCCHLSFIIESCLCSFLTLLFSDEDPCCRLKMCDIHNDSPNLEDYNRWYVDLTAMALVAVAVMVASLSEDKANDNLCSYWCDNPSDKSLWDPAECRLILIPFPRNPF